MSSLSITHKNKQADGTVIIVGHCDEIVTPVVERVATGLAEERMSGIQTVWEDQYCYLVGKLPAEAWLQAGGEAWRVLGGQILSAVRAAGLKRVAIAVAGSNADPQSLVEGLLLADYAFRDCRSGKAAKVTKLEISVPGHKEAVRAGVQAGEAQNLARHLADSPPNLLFPKSFAKRVEKIFADLPVEVEVISGLAALKKAGFPGLVQVGQGSKQPPALVSLRYTPANAGKDAPHLALVGKGITFDTGGISIKPAADMWQMKGDMGGAAAVVGGMRLIAEQQPALPVTAYLALAENMPDGAAGRPGDVYRARNGTWVHVDNTDAEGRLVLADVLSYACEQGATHLVDAATLTGAALIGLGTSMAAVMGRHEEWVQAVRDAGGRRGEVYWPLPLYGEYRQQLDHPHADLNNSGGRLAGTITAGIFLSEFVPAEVRWAHVDIAGPAMRCDGWRYFGKGMTGFGTRMFAAIAEDLAAQTAD